MAKLIKESAEWRVEHVRQHAEADAMIKAQSEKRQGLMQRLGYPILLIAISGLGGIVSSWLMKGHP